MKDHEIKVGKHIVKITNPDRILFPEHGLTKSDLIDYYKRIASTMIPHIKDRPLTMHRFPSGIDEDGFYQKNASDYFPEWIKTTDIKTEDESKVVHYVLCNNAATLVYLANQAVITPHIWLSKLPDLETPDRIIFDLDPPSSEVFDTVCKAAKEFKKMIDQIGLKPFVMTTGSKGLHVVIPIKPEYDFDAVRAFAKECAEYMARTHSDYLTTQVRKAKREGKIFVDYLRNAWAQTGVAPYAVRAREGAPVATPIDWDEVTSELHPQKYTIKNMFRRLGQIDDPWADINKHARSIKDISVK